MEIIAQIDDHDSDLNIRIRVVKMTVMWTTCSFAAHLLNIMNKYLEGTIFTNMYIEGMAGGIGMVVAVKLYDRFGVKISFVVAFGLCFFGSLLVYFYESGIFHLPLWYLNEFEGPIKQKNILALNCMIPRFTFIAKLGIIIAFMVTYQASLSNEDIFPSDKRSTCIGHCQIVARAATILVYEIAELPKPKPIAYNCLIVLLALLVSFTI